MKWEGPVQEIGTIDAFGWLRVVRRGFLAVLVILFFLLPMLILRLMNFRRAAGALVQMTCKSVLFSIGLSPTVIGRPMSEGGAYVANHSSWLDIFVMNAAVNAQFVAKSEVARWPGIGQLAKAVGTIFITRDRRLAAQHRDLLQARLKAGDRILFFPEGTTSDGRGILPFRSSLFAALESGQGYRVQAFSVRYASVTGADDTIYSWWGRISFLTHLFWVLSQYPHGHVTLSFGESHAVEDFTSRKEMASRLEADTRMLFAGLDPAKARESDGSGP